ncbi:hypothetical protein BH18ACT7_BH18ACT7_18070 [soil metagenome]
MLRHPLRQRTDELTAHRLRGSDAVHLATAVMAGADRFVTNNRRDFSTDIDEFNITYPYVLPEPVAVPPPSKSIG